jgi:glycine/D-amino acid oxidase-like deaminating enzyme
MRAEAADVVVIGAGPAGSAAAWAIARRGRSVVVPDAFVRRRLGGLDPEPVGEVTCLYTTTATEDFILDRRGPVVICSACSGHGAKFAPLTGEFAAELACGDASPDRRFTLTAHRLCRPRPGPA